MDELRKSVDELRIFVFQKSCSLFQKSGSLSKVFLTGFSRPGHTGIRMYIALLRRRAFSGEGGDSNHSESSRLARGLVSSGWAGDFERSN